MGPDFLGGWALLSGQRLLLKSVCIMKQTSCEVLINEGNFTRVIILHVTLVFPPNMNFLILK